MKTPVAAVEFARRRFALAPFSVLIGALAANVLPSTMTLTTVYPAPSGVYKVLITTGGTSLSPFNTILTRDAGNVGIGTTAPGAKLDVAGSVRIKDGTQGLGKVLTSDGSGLASWQTPAAGSSTHNLVVFTSNGIFTVPSGVTQLWVEVYGGGGGGGGSSTTYNPYVPGAGGGAGGVTNGYVAVTPGQNIAVTVGGGGNAPCGGSGKPGGFSRFLGMEAGGGSGGLATSGSLAVQGGGGGSALGGSINLSGGIGTWGFAFPVGASYVGIMGYGGSNTRGIGGGNDGLASAGGSIFGGGGAGSWAVAGSAGSCFSGGLGGSGGVIIQY